MLRHKEVATSGGSSAAQGIVPDAWMQKCLRIKEACSVQVQQLCLRYRVMVQEHDVAALSIGISAASQPEAAEHFRFVTGLPIKVSRTTTDCIDRFLTVLTQGEKQCGLPEHLQASQADPEEVPVIDLLQNTLQAAYLQKASDIHFEPYANTFQIRLRIDGVLHRLAAPPKAWGKRVVCRVKVMAALNLSEQRLPQDGQFQFISADNKSVPVRVSILPVQYGEKVVLRLLNGLEAIPSIAQLGMSAQHQMAYEQLLASPSGLILFTGPTGSGKTTTMYAGMQALNQGDRNLCSVEDPIEISMPGLNQTALNPHAGLSFSNILSVLLRQDPDVIMVGEIRDSETALLAVQAAHTGHLVLGTIHASSPMGAVERLVQLKVPKEQVSLCLKAVMAQRLLRKLCQHCKQLPSRADPLTTSTRSARSIQQLKFSRPAGCVACRGGYRGRMGIYECLILTPSHRSAICLSGHCRAVSPCPVLGRSLREVAYEKCAQGETSLEEIRRVLGEADQAISSDVSSPGVGAQALRDLP